MCLLRPVRVIAQKNLTEIGETLLFICYNKGMKAIPREAGRITYSTEIRNLKQLIIRALKQVHGIEAKIQNNKGYYRIYIPARSKITLMNLIKPLVHASMQYKFG